jgi:hypothetical protein
MVDPRRVEPTSFGRLQAPSLRRLPSVAQKSILDFFPALNRFRDSSQVAPPQFDSPKINHSLYSPPNRGA